MKKIEAIIRPLKLEELKDALNKADVHGITISQVMGCGRQGGWTEYYRSSEVLINVLPKIKIEIVLEDSKVDKIIDLIINTAQTGEVGDGKIFLFDVCDCIRIRTKERGDKAL
ncbi:P-II family nitrogen regulator [Clostridium sp. HCP1S3_B4]|uniref:P-II family nitrogen regulator n=1 Tax=unclassified Clostridium TaxID=2614128 RepID=UPI002A7872EA|nr:P-II family nitrogen regulator [Clostridium sp.]